MRNPFPVPFPMSAFHEWTHGARPTQIEMDDQEYAHFAALVGKNAKDYRGVPIVFLDAPKV